VNPILLEGKRYLEWPITISRNSVKERCGELIVESYGGSSVSIITAKISDIPFKAFLYGLDDQKGKLAEKVVSRMADMVSFFGAPIF
jgi:hypothetical protein